MRSAVMFGLVAVAVSSLVATVRSQRDPAAIEIQKVKENLYVIVGGAGATPAQGVSGNTTVVVTDAGVVLVDTKLPGYGGAILDQVRSVTDQPVVMVINTHTHADHLSGNVELPGSVARVAHANARAGMARLDVFKGSNAAALPDRTFSDRLSLTVGRERIELFNFGRGHTNGDTIVVFPGLRTAVMGDLFARKGAPAVDTANGGSMSELPAMMARVVSSLQDIDTVITGHANTPAARPGPVLPSDPVMTWNDLREYAEFLSEFVGAARAALAAGKSVDEALDSWPLPDRYRGYEMSSARAGIQRLQAELKP
jgi:glyoxylase-like metal-dependent hydrolase (beta-lactamase superfamily II)